MIVTQNLLFFDYQGTSMKYFFYPADKNQFKQAAVGSFVRTLVVDINKDEVVVTFVRQVSKIWEQSCKNNIETDHRIRALSGEHFQIYNWVVKSKNDFSLPGFGVIR